MTEDLNLTDGNTDTMKDKHLENEIVIPEWVLVGESVLIRPYNTSGVIGFVGMTHFQVSKLYKLIDSFQIH